MYPLKQVHIGKVIRDAHAFNPQNWGKGAMNTDGLLQSVARLFDLLREREIDYVLVGGIALLNYVEGRNTEDIDLIMALSALKELPEIVITSQDADFARGKFGDLQIDFLLTQNKLFEKILRENMTIQRFDGQLIPTATVDGLLLLKLYALPSLYRLGDFTKVGIYENDIATLVYSYSPELDSLLEKLTLHLSEADMTELRTIVTEIKQKIVRFKKKTVGNHGR
jgi:hypothetical protein